MYGKGILQLPETSLGEEFKCIKVHAGVRMWFSGVWIQSQRKRGNGTKGWHFRRQRQFTRNANSGKPAWNEAGPKGNRKQIVKQICRWPEVLRGAKVVVPAK